MADLYSYHPIFKPLCKTIIALLSNFEVHGQDNYIKPPFFLTTNHLSYCDAPVLVATCPHDVVSVAKKTLEHTGVGWFLRNIAAAVFLDRDEPDRTAIRQMLNLVKEGYPIGIGVEGTRSRTGKLQKGFNGAAFMIRKSGVPIIPAGMTNTNRILKSPHPKVSLKIGKPYHLPPVERGNRDLDKDTDRIMCAIAALLPEEQHGYYAGNPLIDEMRPIVT